MAPLELKETHSTDTAAAPQPVSTTSAPSGESSSAPAPDESKSSTTQIGSLLNAAELSTEVLTLVGVQSIPQLAPLAVPPVLESSRHTPLQSLLAPPLGSDSSAPQQLNVESDHDLDDAENLDTDELPDNVMDTSTETLPKPRDANQPSTKPTTG